jgi:hypothetical protein
MRGLNSPSLVKVAEAAQPADLRADFVALEADQAVQANERR